MTVYCTYCDSREGDGEVEPLPQAPEGNEGLSGEAAGGHLAVGLLVLPVGTLAHETARQPVHAPAAIFADAGHAPVRRRVQLTVLTCEEKQASSAQHLPLLETRPCYDKSRSEVRRR